MTTWWCDLEEWSLVLEIDDCLASVLLCGAAAEEGLLLLHGLTHSNYFNAMIKYNNKR